jgi:hypothetical protein
MEREFFGDLYPSRTSIVLRTILGIVGGLLTFTVLKNYGLPSCIILISYEDINGA